MQNENIQLILPPSEDFEAVAQTTIAHLAIRRGFTLNEVEDLRLIMAETTRLLLKSEQSENIYLSYEVTKEHLTLEAHLDESAVSPLPQEGIERFTKVVGALLDNFRIDNEKHHIYMKKYRLGDGN